MMKATLIVAAMLVAGAAAQAPAALEIPSSCSPKFTCKGTGNQLYSCNGTSLVGLGSDVKLECDGEAGSGTYGYDTSGAMKMPTYTLACGTAEGDTSTQKRVPNPSGAKTDSGLYRRAASKATGCLSDVEYIVRSDASGGVAADTSCTTSGGRTEIPYTGTWQFLSC